MMEGRCTLISSLQKALDKPSKKYIQIMLTRIQATQKDLRFYISLFLHTSLPVFSLYLIFLSSSYLNGRCLNL